MCNHHTASMYLLAICLALFGSAYSYGYWDIQLSPQSISSVPFFGGHISVWEHATTPGRYYAMPLVYLTYDSASVMSNIFTGQHEMSFTVLMWTVEAKEAVYRHLKVNVNNMVKAGDVEMLPMEKIRIVWRDRTRPISSDFKLVEHWKSNTHLPSQVTFRVTCADGPKCEQLKQAMKTSPAMFDALELEYVINGQRSARRVLTVTGSHVVDGNLFTRLNNMPGAASNGDRYLTSNDLKTITSETVSNVIGSVVTDADYVDTGDEVSLKDVLMNELKKQEVSSQNFQPHMWNSVFWNPLWARPDKLTQYLNKVLSKDTNDSRKFILDENQRSNSREGKVGGSFLGISLNAGGGSSSSSQTKLQRDDVLKTLRERHNDIEWTGEVFRVKPMKLSRLNLSTLRSTATIVSANIQVRRYEAVQSIKLRIRQTTGQQTPSLSPQLVESRLMAKITESTQMIRNEIAQTDSQLNTKITETHQRIAQTDSRLNTKITETHQMIAQTDSRLDTTIMETHQKFAQADSRLNTTITEKNQKIAQAGWPAKNHFCIFANGNCPPGFTRHAGYVRGIYMYAGSRSYITTATWGSSKIQCNGRCGSSNYNGEIWMTTCCR